MITIGGEGAVVRAVDNTVGVIVTITSIAQTIAIGICLVAIGNKRAVVSAVSYTVVVAVRVEPVWVAVLIKVVCAVSFDLNRIKKVTCAVFGNIGSNRTSVVV